MYIKKNAEESKIVAQAMELISWFINHSHVLALLLQEQLSYPQFSKGGLTLLRPCITQWGSHSLALMQLLVLKEPFISLAQKYARLNYNEDLLKAAGEDCQSVTKA